VRREEDRSDIGSKNGDKLRRLAGIPNNSPPQNLCKNEKNNVRWSQGDREREQRKGKRRREEVYSLCF
jgi:hypothetical protein